jgi:hypothetical protein
MIYRTVLDIAIVEDVNDARATRASGGPRGSQVASALLAPAFRHFLTHFIFFFLGGNANRSSLLSSNQPLQI